MIKSLAEIANEEAKRRCLAAKDHYAHSICSIYGLVDKRDFPHLGSGTVVSESGRYFLVTARHLLEEGRKLVDFQAMTPWTRSGVSLNRRFAKSVDEQDLAVCELTGAEVAELQIVPIPLEDFAYYPTPTSGRVLCTLGWPNTKNKLNQYNPKQAVQLLMTGAQKKAVDAGSPDFSDDEFVFQKFDPRDSVDDNDARTNAPKLQGLSGGLIFDLGNPVSPREIATDYSKPIPIAICTMRDKKNKTVRGSRPWGFLDAVLNSAQQLS